MKIYSIKKERQFSLLNKSGYKFYNPQFIMIFKHNFILDNSIKKANTTSYEIKNKSYHFKDINQNSNSKGSLRPYKNNVCNRESYNINADNNNTIFLGFKVSRKVGCAVIRNKIKRRIRHLAKLSSKILVPNNYGMIIIPRTSFATIKFSILIDQMTKILSSYLIK